METWLPIATAFAIFIPALMLPGPDFIAVSRAALTRGAGAGAAASLGVATGLAFYAALSLGGLSALLVQHQWLAVAVRVLGGAYLVYLGVTLLLAPSPAADGDAQAASPTNPRRAFLFGIAVTLTNPKAVVLFASVFATAVTAETSLSTMIGMVVAVWIISAAWYVAVSVALASRRATRGANWLRRRMDRIVGAVFVALGGKIMADARNPLSP